MSQTLEPNEKISGTIVRVVFRNQQTGFHILKVNSENSHTLETVLGVGANTLEPGHKIIAKGSWETDKKFGRQFRTKSIQASLPSETKSIISFLSSGSFKGIGPIKAQRIVEKFGKKTFDVLDNEPDALLKIKGITEKELDFIKVAWASQKDAAVIMTQLHGFGISPNYVNSMYKKLGVNALNILNENPYRLINEIWGIGFAKADEIALNNGMDRNDPKRVKAGIAFVLSKSEEIGSCGLGVSNLEEDSEELLGVNKVLIQKFLKEEVEQKNVYEEIINDERVMFTSRLFRFENSIARRIKQINLQNVPWIGITPEGANNLAQSVSDVNLSEQQLKAVKTAFSNNLSIITGGPGVGKTTLTNTLLKIFERINLEIILCAPTGTAAKKMAMATQHKASTIHQTLGYDPISKRMRYDSSQPLDCDVVVVDEVSMIDVELMANLLDAIGPQTALILIGDVDQLPSIGPGKVLVDLIHSRNIPVVFLKEIFRQSANSQIITASQAIQKGIVPSLKSERGKSDFYFIQIENPQKCLTTIKKLVLDRIPNNFGFDPVREIQVLSPMKNGVIGINNLNEILQNSLNPSRDIGIIHRQRKFTKGDKVIQNTNNYEKEVYNGDIGFIDYVDPTGKSLKVDFSGLEVNFDFDELDEIDPAYAITIHKSQGSEYPAVIIPVMMQHRIMLQRKLIYTGLTRGKNLVVMVGQQKAFALAIKNRPLGKIFARPRISRLDGLLAS